MIKANKPVKVAKITLYGGFHHSKAINVIIKESDLEDLKSGNIPLVDVLSPSQIKRLDRHFCGVAGCCCNGVRDASWCNA